jgi:hypothetical protein
MDFFSCEHLSCCLGQQGMLIYSLTREVWRNVYGLAAEVEFYRIRKGNLYQFHSDRQMEPLLVPPCCRL